MTRQDLRTLLDFHYWARDRMFDAIEPLTLSSSRAIWGTAFPPFATQSSTSTPQSGSGTSAGRGTRRRRCCRLTSFQTSRHYGASGSNTSRRSARMSRDRRRGRRPRDAVHAFSGVSSTSPFWQMLQHVVNHASYHRGQVTTMLRQLGAAPAKSCDLITFYRELANTGGQQRRNYDLAAANSSWGRVTIPA